MSSIHVRALFFASYRELAGTGELVIQLPPGASAASAVAEVRARNAALARIPERPAVAINREYASLDEPLQDGDELAFLPPVAGG